MKRTREDLAPHTPSVLLVTRFSASGDRAAKKEKAGEKQRDVHISRLLQPPNPSSFLSLYFIRSIQAQSSSERSRMEHEIM
ncbi:hypothetical protein DPX16_22436 [Anabarilius grahami]|uniref:Uncharacterized protein n=1 Tax=Anabarilius grahami TaxID=495550 RepID=A0A3N0YYU7_ANAGA|nr:hypothetical protein DPX16_22436 [Anabarilius grahami]